MATHTPIMQANLQPNYGSAPSRNSFPPHMSEHGGHIIPGDFDEMANSSPVPNSLPNFASISNIGRNNNNYEISAARGEHPSSSGSEGFGGGSLPSDRVQGHMQMVDYGNGNQGQKMMDMGMIDTKPEANGGGSFPGAMRLNIPTGQDQQGYQPPDSMHGNGAHNGGFSYPIDNQGTAPVPIPLRQGESEFGGGSRINNAWEARNPPPLSSTSTTTATTAITPITSRTYPYYQPGTEFVSKSAFNNSFSSNGGFQNYQTPNMSYNTPNQPHRRPLLTTPSSVPLPAPLVRHFPVRQLPSGNLTNPTFVLPRPAQMPPQPMFLDSQPAYRRDGFPVSSSYMHPYGVERRVPRGAYMVQDRETGEWYIHKSPPKPPKEHRCPTCNKNFARPSALQTHQAVHTGAKRESSHLRDHNQ